MYRNADISRFLKTHLSASLADYRDHYKSRDVVRTRANFYQMVIAGVNKGGWVHVVPAAYVVGAEPAEDCVHQTVSLSSLSPDAWKFPPDTSLGRDLADEIVKRLETGSELPFLGPLSDDKIDSGLRWFGRRGQHWSAELFLAFFNMSRGAPSAREDLAFACKAFVAKSSAAHGKSLQGWEESLLERFSELEARLDSPDCIALCRAEAEQHAGRLKLPPIVWPAEWPESVPPWPPSAGGGGLLKRLFGK